VEFNKEWEVGEGLARSNQCCCSGRVFRACAMNTVSVKCVVWIKRSAVVTYTLVTECGISTRWYAAYCFFAFGVVGKRILPPSVCFINDSGYSNWMIPWASGLLQVQWENRTRDTREPNRLRAAWPIGMLGWHGESSQREIGGNAGTQTNMILHWTRRLPWKNVLSKKKKRKKNTFHECARYCRR